MASTLSFQGVTSGLQTDTLIAAIIAADSGTLERLQARQTKSTERSAALASMRTGLSDLTLSIAKLYDSLNSRAISTTDADKTYVTATATGAASGSYEVKVSSVATKGKLSPLMSGSVPTNMAVADPNAAILTSANGSFAVKGTDGVVKAFTLTNNSLYGLRDAINASGAGVSATVINSGSGTNPYQLVVTAKETGTGTTGGVVELAAINNEDAGNTATTVVTSLGITSGTLTGTIAAPTALSGGLSSTGDGIANDALFTVNGIELTRQSNTVKDVVDGVTFTLKKGDATNATTLTVGQDTTAATTGMQDLISKYNAIIKTYKDATTVTQDEDGETTTGALVGDSVARSVISQLRTTLSSEADGISSSAAYKSAGAIGLKTSSDGTLSLDTTIFKAALEKDPEAVMKVFSFSGTSTNGTASFTSGTDATATGSMDFNLTYGTDGAISGSLTYGGTTYSGLTGTNGTLQGPKGTPLEGLRLAVTGSGSGTMTLSRGVGQKLQDLISSLTSYTGTIEKTRASIDTQKTNLTTQIEVAQARLDKKEAALKAQFDKMEATITQMRAASSLLSS